MAWRWVKRFVGLPLVCSNHKWDVTFKGFPLIGHYFCENCGVSIYPAPKRVFDKFSDHGKADFLSLGSGYKAAFLLGLDEGLDYAAKSVSKPKTKRRK